MQPRKHTATHRLDGISWLHVNNSNGAQEVHNSHSRHWMNHFCCQFEILHLTFLLPPIFYVQNFLFYNFEFLTFFPLSLAYSVYCQMCLMSHPHTVIQVKLCHQHWIMTLTSWNICWYHLLWPRQKLDSHMILLNFSHGSRKCFQLTYLKIAMSKPRCSLVNQVLLCSFECSYLYKSSENVPLLEYP